MTANERLFPFTQGSSACNCHVLYLPQFYLHGVRWVSELSYLSFSHYYISWWLYVSVIFFYYVYADSFSFICLRFERCPTPIIVSFISCVSTVKKKKILNLINMMLCQSLFNIMLSIPTTPTVSKIRLIKTGSTARLIWVNWPLTHFLLLSSNQKYTITFFFLNAQVGWKKTRDMDSCYAFHTFLNRHEYSANTISKQEIINKKPEEEKF